MLHTVMLNAKEENSRRINGIHMHTWHVNRHVWGQRKGGKNTKFGKAHMPGITKDEEHEGENKRSFAMVAFAQCYLELYALLTPHPEITSSRKER